MAIVDGGAIGGNPFRVLSAHLTDLTCDPNADALVHAFDTGSNEDTPFLVLFN